MWIINYNKKCDNDNLIVPPKIIYRYHNELDLQFEPNNSPTVVYDNLFNGTNVAQGGYQLLNTGRISSKIKQP